MWRGRPGRVCHRHCWPRTKTRVEHVVEVGGPGTLAQSLRAIRIGGKVTMIGVLSGAAEINPMLIFARRANVQGISVGLPADVRSDEPRDFGERFNANHR